MCIVTIFVYRATSVDNDQARFQKINELKSSAPSNDGKDVVQVVNQTEENNDVVVKATNDDDHHDEVNERFVTKKIF